MYILPTVKIQFNAHAYIENAILCIYAAVLTLKKKFFMYKALYLL